MSKEPQEPILLTDDRGGGSSPAKSYYRGRLTKRNIKYVNAGDRMVLTRIRFIRAVWASSSV